MKRREGFVSNSSSTSFVVLGAKITESELKRLVPQKPEESEDDYEDRLHDEGLQGKIGKTEVNTVWDDSGIHVGMCGEATSECMTVISEDPAQAVKDIEEFFEKNGINKKVQLIATPVQC